MIGNPILLLKALDPNVTLYLYEPMDCLEKPHWNTNHLQLIMTCSPDEKRYKELKKKGGVMPTWTLDELLLLGNHLLTKNGNQQVDFSEAAIKEDIAVCASSPK